MKTRRRAHKYRKQQRGGVVELITQNMSKEIFNIKTTVIRNIYDILLVKFMDLTELYTKCLKQCKPVFRERGERNVEQLLSMRNTRPASEVMSLCNNVLSRSTNGRNACSMINTDNRCVCKKYLNLYNEFALIIVYLDAFEKECFVNNELKLFINELVRFGKHIQNNLEKHSLFDPTQFDIDTKLDAVSEEYLGQTINQIRNTDEFTHALEAGIRQQKNRERRMRTQRIILEGEGTATRKLIQSDPIGKRRVSPLTILPGTGTRNLLTRTTNISNAPTTEGVFSRVINPSINNNTRRNRF